MEVNSSLIEKLSTLSRLQFNEMEKEEIRQDLQRMIHFVEKLNELNLEGVEPLLHIPDENNVLREDLVKGELTREQALKNAPSQNGEFFLVPKVIQKR
ncbi:MAG: Asp-tRNA(Asn)/Glu-tRNA(Gln) amidotransferase subunit GatC [Chitinophagaceae bacterium]|nr:Asp-tRNA(Asn)/Glu-tRNA(Gln) amidotransferase subunit GatC [Chitinophagaceae bacterium]